jgi:malonate decarboxylase beta subunit
MRAFRESYLELTARQRIEAILDPGSFIEYLSPPMRITSPHLALLDLPVALDDGIVAGGGLIDGLPVLIAAQEGRFMGGSVGEVHGAKLTGLLERALAERPAGVVLLIDTGGVRLHEANAGLIAMGEIQRAILDLRHAAIPVIAVIGGSNGCYGGLSIAARSASFIIVSEEGRLSVSGPEVIESVSGAEEFESRDRALVWATMGGKHRVLMGDADALVEDDVRAFRRAIAEALRRPARSLSVEDLERQHALLGERLLRFGDARASKDIWATLGVPEPEQISDMTADAFNALAAGLRAERAANAGEAS